MPDRGEAESGGFAARGELVDVATTLLLADAAMQAYTAFEDPGAVVAPPGYELVGSWSGVDPVARLFAAEESFGLIFRRAAAPGEVIFAFRGTDSLYDAWEDLCASPVPFQAHAPVEPDGRTVRVCDGFWSVYASADGARGVRSQQAQLFDWYDALRPTTLMITGHSLGAALATLFTLDLSLSRPHAMPTRRIHVGFASPRVGCAEFAELYARQPFEQDPRMRTVRVLNAYDYVPRLPPARFGYTHVGVPFATAFHERGALVAHPLVRHHMGNYQLVLDRGLPLPGRRFLGSMSGQDGVPLACVEPPVEPVRGVDGAGRTQPPPPLLDQAG